MKKKMTILAVLLLAVAVTTYSVTGTYAKYTSKFDMTDEARVAKWEFVFTDAEGNELVNDFNIDLFQESYESFNGTNTDTVSSESGVKVVAPGTYGEYLFNLDGTAETNYTVAIDATINNEIIDGNYNPIFFRLDGGNWMNSDDLEDALESLYDGKVFEANDTLDKTHKIEWVWAFDTKNNVSSATGNQDDIYFNHDMPSFTTDDETDTYLAQPKADGTYRKINVNIVLTLTQSELESNEWAANVPDNN